MQTTSLPGGDQPMRVAATFDDAAAAHRAASELIREMELANEKVRVVDPDDPLVVRNLRTGTRGVVRTLVRKHVKFALTGLCAGVLVALALAWGGIAVAESKPQMVIVGLGALGLVIGLLAAGLIMRRPGLVRMNSLALDAARTGQWMVVAHTSDRAEGERARDMLLRQNSEVLRAP